MSSPSNPLESLVRLAGNELADAQVARLFKVPEEMQQTPCDFFGYTASGRAILVECKMVSSRSSLPIGTAPGLRPHQWCELTDANRADALALICWAHKGTVAVISVDMATKLSEGRKSIPWGSIDPFYHRSMQRNRVLELFDLWLPVTAASPR